uniref:Uncharacterized protein n=1 Tax=Myoviridae sp. ctfvB24 TaxID=2826679 RepID=A0A8S5M905_9CAUD|nr:MAG TPA: hypothetical protein [Myoviridae sp. ctfvB24]
MQRVDEDIRDRLHSTSVSDLMAIIKENTVKIVDTI